MEVLKNGLPKGTLLNVNFPKIENSIKGIKICRQAHGNWVEEFEYRVDPHHRDYYWMTGRYDWVDRGEDTDVYAINNGYVSIVPTQFDMTAHHTIQELNSWSFDIN